MYFTWTFIIILFCYPLLLLCLPGAGYLYYGLLALIFLWLVDCVITIRQPQVKAERRYPINIYQNRPAVVELAVFNPLNRSLRICLKDEPPFEAVAVKPEGWLSIPKDDSAVLLYDLTIPKRGVFWFGDVNYKVCGRLMLYQQYHKLKLTQSINVYPNLVALDNYQQLKLVGSENEGFHRAKLFGIGGELSQLREFVRGDDYRKINWKVLAHAHKPFINEYEPEKDQNVFLFFDSGRLLFNQINENKSRFDFILDAAILLVYSILKRGDLVGALSFSHKVDRYLPVGKGPRQLQQFISAFFNLEAVMVESDYRTAFGFWSQRNNKRSLLFLYTDIIDTETSKDLINHLLITCRHHLVVCVLLKRPYLDNLIENPILDEKNAYQKGIALELLKKRDSLKRMLKNHGIELLEVDANNIKQAVVEHYYYLKETGKF